MDDQMTNQVAAVVEPLGVELVDVEHVSGTLRVTVDREGGIDLDELAKVNHAVSAWLDEADPFTGRYTLEVSSPGVERRLRTPAQFERALGEEVTVRLTGPIDGQRRFNGILAAVDGDHVVVNTEDGERRLPISDVERARTIFHWGASPKPSPSRGKPRTHAKESAKP